MKLHSRWNQTFVVMALLSLSNLTFAHGSNAHSEKAMTSAQDAEQMPWGVAGMGKAVDRTIEVSTLDQMRFTPSTLSIKKDETIKFIVRNSGKVMHEFVLGTTDSNAKHAALMVKFPGMEHDAPYMAHVAPGSVGEITWTFNQTGEYQFACLIAGHYQAGMVGSLKVSEQ